ncbi:hypothetical protein ACEWBP_22610, partial [Vibrio parahaemolyticus]
ESDGSSGGNWAINTLSFFADGLKQVFGTLLGLKYVQAFSGIVAAISDVISSLEMPFLFAGIYVGFMIPLYLIMQITKALILYLLEGIASVVFSPITISLVFIDVFGVRMVSYQDHVNQLIRLLLTGSLIVISYILYWELGGVGFYMVNSVAGALNFTGFDGSLSSLIPSFVAYLLTMGMTVILYCGVEKFCREQGFELGNSALNMIGVQSIFKSMGGNISSAIGAYMIANQVTQTLNIVSARAKQEAAASQKKRGDSDNKKGNDSSESIAPQSERKMSDTPTSETQTNNTSETDGGMSRDRQKEAPQQEGKSLSQNDKADTKEEHSPGSQRSIEPKND